MSRRIFTAKEISRILGSQIHDAEQDISIDLGGGLRAVPSAAVYKALKAGEKPDYNFFLESEGKEDRPIEQATQEELEKISDFIWRTIAPKFQDSREELDEKLTPDELKEKPDEAEGEERLVPYDLREKKENPDLEPDPLGLTPDWARKKKDPAKPTAEDLLTPDDLK